MPQIWGSAFIALIMIPRGEEIGVFLVGKSDAFQCLIRAGSRWRWWHEIAFFFFFVNFSERCVCIKGLNCSSSACACLSA